VLGLSSRESIMKTKSNYRSDLLFSICIITFRRADLLRRCLECLSTQVKLFEPHQYEVLVSDDCPSQSSYEVVKQTGFATWIQGPNRGVAANRNNVANAAHSNWIIYIDDDEIPNGGWLTTIYNTISSDKYDVIEGKVEPINYPDSILWYAPVINFAGVYCTANLAIRRDKLINLGGFNEDLLVSHEDIEMGSRIRKAGLRTVYLEKAIVYHPARKMKLTDVWRRMIDLQHQSYVIKFLDKDKSLAEKIISLCSFTLKYWYRVTRLEFAARHKGHMKRAFQIGIMLILTIPFGFLNTLGGLLKTSPKK
jgi:GT2 family glycosyltransferase